MTVDELIQELSKYPSDATVQIVNDEGVLNGLDIVWPERDDLILMGSNDVR